MLELTVRWWNVYRYRYNGDVVSGSRNTGAHVGDVFLSLQVKHTACNQARSSAPDPRKRCVQVSDVERHRASHPSFRPSTEVALEENGRHANGF